MKSTIQSIFSGITAGSTFAIACLLAYNAFTPKVERPQATRTEVVEVVDRVITSGTRASGATGFLVKNGSMMFFVPYDPGSMFAKMPTPRYMKRTVFAGGETTYVPVQPY